MGLLSCLTAALLSTILHRYVQPPLYAPVGAFGLLAWKSLIEPADNASMVKYVCYDNQFLCPIVSGEPLSYCSGACYSKFQYTCNDNVLETLPPVAEGTPFSLTASNPGIPIDGKAVTACGRHWTIDGTTCTYCPDEVGDCPPGDITAVNTGADGGASMNVEVPGGQRVYLDPYWNMGYTQAHSASIPPGSLISGFAAYSGGGFVNLNGNGYGWVACPPTSPGGGGEDGWNLVAKNASNSDILGNCYGVNLKVKELDPNSYAAWQYT